MSEGVTIYQNPCFQDTDMEERGFYGNYKQSWKTWRDDGGDDKEYIMIHRDTCRHMRHVKRRGMTGWDTSINGWHYCHGNFSTVFLWAMRKKKDQGLSINFCSSCKPPKVSEELKDMVQSILDSEREEY